MLWLVLIFPRDIGRMLRLTLISSIALAISSCWAAVVAFLFRLRLARWYASCHVLFAYQLQLSHPSGPIHANCRSWAVQSNSSTAHLSHPYSFADCEFEVCWVYFFSRAAGTLYNPVSMYIDSSNEHIPYKPDNSHASACNSSKCFALYSQSFRAALKKRHVAPIFCEQISEFQRKSFIYKIDWFRSFVFA